MNQHNEQRKDTEQVYYYLKELIKVGKSIIYDPYTPFIMCPTCRVEWGQTLSMISNYDVSVVSKGHCKRFREDSNDSIKIDVPYWKEALEYCRTREKGNTFRDIKGNQWILLKETPYYKIYEKSHN